ncbi:MAG: alcohol dehydrogenase catalytic domain-containing protein [Bacteroidota bacterium]
MKGVIFTGDRQLEVRDFPIPEPGPGEVRIKIMASGICGSDLHVWRGDQAMGNIGGHEPCGIVDAVGEGMLRVKVGDRVTVHHHQGCGCCPACAGGETVMCTNKLLSGVQVGGSFAEYCIARERACIPLTESLSFVDGAFMACVGGTAYGAYKRMEPWPWQSVAVFGLGPVGLSCALVGKALGLRVVGMDVIPERMAAAAKCGLDLIVDGKSEDAVARMRAFGKGPDGWWGDGVDNLIETSGATAAREMMIPVLRREGKIMIVGVGGTDKVINPSQIHGAACHLIGSVVYRLDWMWEMARFMATSGLSFEPAVTHYFPLEKAEEAVALADSGKCGKIVFLPNG